MVNRKAPPQGLLTRDVDESPVLANAYWRAGSATPNHGEPER